MARERGNGSRRCGAHKLYELIAQPAVWKDGPCEHSSAGRISRCQREDGGFESRCSLLLGPVVQGYHQTDNLTRYNSLRVNLPKQLLVSSGECCLRHAEVAGWVLPVCLSWSDASAIGEATSAGLSAGSTGGNYQGDMAA